LLALDIYAKSSSRLRKYQAGALIQLPRLCFLE
jgi:hypothetical protein